MDEFQTTDPVEPTTPEDQPEPKKRNGNGHAGRYIKNSKMVAEFMRTFGQPIADAPAFPPRRVAWMRLKLILEEVWELIVAMARRDMVGIADAITDILVVVYGMGITYGIDVDACFREVMRSNMSKMGADGKPVYRADGKVTKGENYQPPDLRKVMGL